MPRKPKASRSQVEEKISKLADAVPEATGEGQAQYEQEAAYAETYRQQQIAERAAALEQDQDKHTWRKGVLASLFIMTCLWLLFVVLVVCLSATSPSITDRNALENLGVKVRYCPVFFKLSDTVLVSFITSTTVSVLGLFMVAAKWLFPSAEKAPKKAV
jgi:ABC-type Fe3+ transport system permease subunit